MEKIDFQRIIETICLLNTLQAFIYASIFAFRTGRSLSFLLLACFLFAFSGTSIQWIFNRYVPPFSLLALTFSYATAPLFYLYARSVTGRLTRKDLAHLLPGAVELLANVFLSVQHEYAAMIFRQGTGWLVIALLIVIPPLYNAFYAVWTILHIRKVRALLPQFFTQYEVARLRWIIVTASILGCSMILELASSLGMLASHADWLLYIVEALETSFVVYWITIYGANQRNLWLYELPGDTTPVQVQAITDTPLAVVADAGQAAVAADDGSLLRYHQIVQYLESTRIFTNKDISLYMLADLLDMPYKEVSKAINRHAEKNFSQFINTFRVEEAKRLLNDPAKSYLNLNGIADEVGFSSRSNFFVVFRQAEGITPNEYKKRLIEQPAE